MRRVGEVVAENSAGVTVWRIKRRPVWTGWRHNGAALLALTGRHDAGASVSYRILQSCDHDNRSCCVKDLPLDKERRDRLHSDW